MFKKSLPFFIYCETPVHVGSGSELGYVDLPIQRERHSGFPKIEASSLKGCMRDFFSSDENYKDPVNLIFGPEDGDLHAGSLGFIDGRILLFPVKSVRGIFAWVTCPLVLSRFSEEYYLFNEDNKNLLNDIDEISNIKEYSITKNSNLTMKNNNDFNRKILILEEYKFEVKEDETLTKFAEILSKVIFPINASFDYYKELREKMKVDIVVLSNDDFRDFTELSTEVITRTKIDPIKHTVATGALFNEEYAPENTIFYSAALASNLYGMNQEEKMKKYPDKKDEDVVLEYFAAGINENGVLQIGGNETLGKGIVRIVPMNEVKSNG